MLITITDQSGTTVEPTTLLGTHKGSLWVGSFSAGITLNGGVTLMFNHPGDVPKELRPSKRAYMVPVVVKIYADESDSIVYDAERSGPDFL